jgi:hypothetical protein
MAAPKTTDEILAAPDAFKAAHARAAAAFGKIDGVINVGYGLKQIAGKFGNQFAIVVYVREKKPSEALAPAERIPPVFEEYSTDVRVAPFLRLGACDNTTQYTTIQGGIQIGNAGGISTFPMGTLGCIVRRRNHAGRENVYALSNAHVVYLDGHGPGDPLYHPSKSGSTLGPIQDGGAFRNIPWPPNTPQPGLPANQTFIDCAIARVDLDSCCGCTKDTTAYVESVIDLVNVTPPDAGRGDPVHASNRITDVRDVFGDLAFAAARETVTKVGRTTGRTQGICVSVTTTFQVPNPFAPGTPIIDCLNCLEIEFDPTQVNCKGHAYFGEEGDSGSLIVDSQNRAIGVLFSVPNPNRNPPDPPGHPSGAVHIVPVLDHLGICIPCDAGNAAHVYQHGASLATDGSGFAPIPLPPAQSTLPAGQIVFTAGGAPAMPVNEEHAQRMHAYLEEFRRTRLGVPLNAVINEVRREIGYLIRNVRPVKVVWGRHQGPAWLTHVLNHFRGYAPTIPHEVKGVTRRAFLLKMREVLIIYGSNPLKRALATHGDDVLEMLTFEGCDSVADVIAWIQKREREQDAERERASEKQPADVEDAS